jgi:hypothetical protein
VKKQLHIFAFIFSPSLADLQSQNLRKSVAIKDRIKNLCCIFIADFGAFFTRIGAVKALLVLFVLKALLFAGETNLLGNRRDLFEMLGADGGRFHKRGTNRAEFDDRLSALPHGLVACAKDLDATREARLNGQDAIIGGLHEINVLALRLYMLMLMFIRIL